MKTKPLISIGLIVSCMTVLVLRVYANDIVEQPGVVGINPNHPFVKALTDGSVRVPLEKTPETEQIAAAVLAKTGSSATLYLVAKRIERFSNQKTCGRIVFAIGQGMEVFSQLGGQLNICEDGRPPWKTCDPGKPLIPADVLCTDGKVPQDTLEVKTAIDRAVESGSFSHEQAKQKFFAN